MRVVIVGCGPAGLITGLHLLDEGIKPLILEKNAELSSTACAEGCDYKSLKKIPFDSSPYISKEVEGAEFMFPGGHSFHSGRRGAVLDRGRWLKGMADEFVGRDGDLRTNARVNGIEKNAVLLSTGERVEYDVLVGADGPHSAVGKGMGISLEIIAGVQYKIEHDTSDVNHMKFYFDKRFSHHYAWVFPKKDMFNIGLSGKFSQLDDFVDFLGLKGRVLAREGGAIPAGGISEKIVRENIALIGDAASMTNPLSGGGIAPIIYAAPMLCRNINRLDEYEREVKKHPVFGSAVIRAKYALMRATNDDMEKMGKVVDGRIFEEMRFYDLLGILRHPLLLPKMIAVEKGIIPTMRWGW